MRYARALTRRRFGFGRFQVKNFLAVKSWSDFLATNDQLGEHIRSAYCLALDAIQNSKSGHVGSALSMTPLMSLLFSDHLSFNLDEENDCDEDVVVLSAGHLCLALYSQLAILGLLEVSELQNYRRLNSRAPGHPEARTTPKVRTTTGPLGQGVGNAVGMAWEASLDAKRKRIVAIVSDGDLQEGVAQEAIALAGNLKLGNLKFIYDANNVTIDGNHDLSSRTNYLDLFKSHGWYASRIDFKIPSDLDELSNSCQELFIERETPSVLIIETTIGFPAVLSQGLPSIHSSALNFEEYRLTRDLFALSDKEFHIPETLSVNVRKRMKDRFVSSRSIENNLSTNVKQFDKIAVDSISSIRDALRIRIAREIEEGNLFGGSCDLSESTGVWNPAHAFPRTNFVNFGVREHCASAFMNGVRGVSERPFFVSTYLAFSDYMRPGIRLSCLDNNGATYIFSHDDVFIGGDGPTHQPVEHLDSLRCIPNLKLFRPSSVSELLSLWDEIFSIRNTSVLVIPRTNKEYGNLGKEIEPGLFLIESINQCKVMNIALLSSGNDIGLCLEAMLNLDQEPRGNVDLYSIPSLEMIIENPRSLLAFEEKLKMYDLVVTVEACRGFSWKKLLSRDFSHFGIHDFGKSATPEQNATRFRYTGSDLVAFIDDKLKYI